MDGEFSRSSRGGGAYKISSRLGDPGGEPIRSREGFITVPKINEKLQAENTPVLQASTPT